jgi:VIT1/CCC1 family predicted Fe2+/Mn2+ transporter
VEDRNEWILGIERQWYIYYWATLCAFYSGVALLLAGINLIVWIFVGTTLAAIFLVAVFLSLGITAGVALFVDRTVTTPRAE